MNAFLISFLVATLALASFANVISTNKDNIFDESQALQTANVTSTHNATTFDMSEALAELFTAVKDVMPCGNATYGIPQMAPFRKPSVKVNFSQEDLGLNGDIENLVITGLDDYIIIQLTTNSSNNRTDMDILYKDIQILGKFNLKVEADISGLKYIQRHEGFINIQVLNLRTTTSLTIGPNEVGGIHLSNVEYSLQVGDIIVNNLNKEWSVAVNNFANRYISDFTKLFLQTKREVFGKMYSEAVTEMVNTAAYNVSLSSLSSTIVDTIKLFKSMRCHHH